MGPSYVRSFTGHQSKHPSFSTLPIAAIAVLVALGCSASEFAATDHPPPKEVTVDPLHGGAGAPRSIGSPN